jgi:hypothetical protein
MKVNKNFTLDIEIVDKLSKMDNGSKIVNDLLSDYFANNGTNLNIFEQNKLKLKQNRLKMRQIRAETRAISTLERYNFDLKCVNWITGKEFIYTDDDIYQYLLRRNPKIKISIEDFIKCSNIVQKNGAIFKNHQ